MGSEQNDGTSYQPSEPKPCANNCGFFGTAENQNLCSKCYRDLRIRQDRSASAKAAMDKSLLHPTTSTSTPILPSAAHPAPAESSTSFEPSSDQVLTSKETNRCRNCNKKVGLTGFLCKCGSIFCGLHRYPEKHQCTYDFKLAGRDAISKANPTVKADKLERF